MEIPNIRKDELDTSALLRESAILFGVKNEDKIDIFEKMIGDELKLSDSVSEAVEKIVKAALSSEFGEEILSKKFSANMIKAISNSIMAEKELRKQALLIMDRLAKPDIINA